jgi:MarR family transcriptional regulator, organic hydroperoxide resistance regulator
MEKTGLITEIIELQRKVDQGRRQYEPDVWIRLNITVPQLKSLFFISHEGTTNLSKLAARLAVTPTNVTGIVDRLLKKGLVTRTESGQDRRILVLKLTEDGEKLVTRLRERRRGYMSDVLARMSRDDLEILARGIKLLANAVENQEGEKENTGSNKETAGRR